MKFRTVSNSLYEVDFLKRTIVRLEGEASPTARQGQNNETKTYQMLNRPIVGMPVLIVWNVTEDGVLQTTRTSPVKEIVEMTDDDQMFFTQVATSLKGEMS